MKKSKLFGLALVATMTGASFSACSNEAEEVLAQESEIRLTSEITPSRVTSLDYQSTQIVEGQQIGVTITGAKSEHNNVAWTAGAEGALSNTGDEIYYGNGTATITAYNPYNTNFTGTSHTFLVSTDQSTDEGYLASDLLWAKETATKSEEAVALTFTHKLAKINVTLVPEYQETDLSGATISICNTKPSTTFNPTTGDISSATGDVEEIKAGVTTSNTYTASAIVIPQTIASGTKFIKVELDGKTFYYTLNADKELKSGYSHNYTLTVKETALEIANSSVIDDWTDENGNTGDANEDVSKLTVTLTEAGTLGNYLTDANKNVIEELKIIGNINGTDIQVIRNITELDNSGKPTENTGALVKLDLSEANIVSGGNSYTNHNGSKTISTQDNKVTAYMFQQTQFKTIILPNNITEIGDHAFETVFNMESFIIPESVTRLGANAFDTSTKLKSITIPESVVEIGRGTFDECAFTEITLPSKLKVIDEDTFAYCRNLKTINLPAELEEIKLGAFYYCESLESLTIPSSIKRIDYAFLGCDKLTEIYCEALTPPTLQITAENRPRCTIYVPANSVEAYKEASAWSSLNIVAKQ